MSGPMRTWRRKKTVKAMQELHPIVEDQILRRGYLLKMGGFHKAWKLRWFVLEPGLLWYFKKPSLVGTGDAQGCIELSDSVVKPANLSGGKDFCFELVTKSRIFLLIARNKQYLESWVYDLSHQTEHTRENALLFEADSLITQAEVSRSLEEGSVGEWESEKSKGWGESLRRTQSIRQKEAIKAIEEIEEEIVQMADAFEKSTSSDSGGGGGDGVDTGDGLDISESDSSESSDSDFDLSESEEEEDSMTLPEKHPTETPP